VQPPAPLALPRTAADAQQLELDLTPGSSADPDR